MGKDFLRKLFKAATVDAFASVFTNLQLKLYHTLILHYCIFTEFLKLLSMKYAANVCKDQNKGKWSKVIVSKQNQRSLKITKI